MAIIQESIKKIHVQRGQRLQWLDIVLFLAVIFYIVAGIPLVPYHGDESAYLILSEDYDHVVIRHDVEKVLFKADGGAKQNLRLSTGSIMAFSIGFARDLTDNDDVRKRWLWGASWEENIAKGNMPAPSILYLARFCSAIMGSLGVVLFFFLVRNISGFRLAAWIATIALATQGGFLVNIRRAMQEGPKFLFLIMTTYVASVLFKRLMQKDIHWPLYFLLGATSGLTLAAKQDTSPMLVAIYLAIFLTPFWIKETSDAILVNSLYLGASVFLAYAFFLVFMPVFWGWWESALVFIGIALILFQIPLLKNDWKAKAIALAGTGLIISMMFVSPSLWMKLHTPLVSMLRLREELVRVQLAYSADQNLFDADSLNNRFPFLLKNTLSSQVMYMESPSFDVPPFYELINAYEASILSGRTGSFLWDGIVFFMVLVGGWALLKTLSAEGLFSFSLLLVTGTMLFFIIPLSWQRYFLILQMPYLLLAGIGAAQIGHWGMRFGKTPAALS